MQENMTYSSADYVADFYKRYHHQVVKTESGWWFNEYHQKYIFYSFPANRQVTPHKAEVDELFRNAPSLIALRFMAPPDGPGKLSSIWVCRKPYSLDVLGKKSRPKTRKGLELCTIRQIKFAELMEKGWQAHSDTKRRHMQQTFSLGLTASLDECRAYEAWGAFHDNSLLAYVVILRVDDWAYILINRFHEFLLEISSQQCSGISSGFEPSLAGKHYSGELRLGFSGS